MKIKSILRLVAASSVNTLIGFIVMGILYKLTENPLLTLILSAALGYIYSIYSYNAIGFARGTRQPPYGRYMVVFGSGLAMNAVLTNIGLNLTRNFLLIQFLVLPAVISFQWLASYFWAFRRED